MAKNIEFGHPNSNPSEFFRIRAKKLSEARSGGTGSRISQSTGAIGVLNFTDMCRIVRLYLAARGDDFQIFSRGKTPHISNSEFGWPKT